MLKTVAGFGGVSGALNYQGTWNAATNTPTLASGVGTKGDYYVVSVAGTTNLDGVNDWQIGDWAVFNGTIWQKVDNTDAVVSVNGQTGVVVLTAANVGATPNTTYVLAGSGLSGGGQLNANVTVSLTTDSTTLGNATLTLGSTTSAVGNLTLNNVNVASGSVTSNNVNLTGTTAATATFATDSLPLVPEGYITVQIGGVNKKIPYYGV